MTRAQARKPWAAAAALLLLATVPAAAQLPGGYGRQRPPQQTPQQSPRPTPTTPAPAEPAAVPEPWPRLEDGALMCKSHDDLVKYQAQVAAGANMIAAVQSAGCHTIRKQVGIKILDRDGPSRTEVVTSDESKETGWTNTYLPATPPSDH